MEAGGWVKLWVWVLVLNASCAAAPGQPRSNNDASNATSTPSIEVPPPPTTPLKDPLLARVDGTEIRVQGKLSPPDADLTATLRQARPGSEGLRATTSERYDDFALARLLSAAQAAGFDRLELDVAGQVLALALSDSKSSPQLIAWNRSGALWLYDLVHGKGATISGPLHPGDTASEDSFREALRHACADKNCRLLAELTPDVGAPTLFKLLESVQRVAGPTSHVRLAVSLTDYHESQNIARKGSLPPAVVQQVVRASYDGFRRCYESGLGRKPELAGRVTARFVIGIDGKVSNVADGGSDIADAEVRDCVLKAFYPLQFPSPGNGIVTVVYPIMLSPG